ncbi:DUF4365 domain-containing protein [Streptomyces sp. MMBL 11-3]|uniref:DUF4365 domain-containing protein n=1 Tax=Streptomyces sp. MMBL 11-3 TaxID=3382639 RepID=UPI0039B438A6
MADFEDLGWGPVENSQHDLGIDLFLQVRDERRFDRTVLMTAQVKAGASYFSSPQHDATGEVTGWWYAESDARHFEDWVQHGLPHLLVLHDLDRRLSYWAQVSKDSVEPSGEGFKVLVPSSQRVERAQVPALLEVAASAKTAWSLEGSAWNAGAKAVAPGRAVRHALIAPRLIAPHPNAGRDRVLAPEEAIALVSQGRADEFQFYLDANPALAELDQQTGWRWRFLHACLRALEDEDVTALLELTADPVTRHHRHSYRRAAAAVACAVFLADAERWQEAESVLDAAGDDLPPVDHAWVLLHQALLAGERGEVARARTLAAECQREVILDSDDITARAIAAAAAAFLFESSRWDIQDLKETLATGDTASSWWRSQSVAWALTDHDRQVFLSWGACEEPGAKLVDWSEERLQGVWLQACFSGSRRAAARPVAQRAGHAVMHQKTRWRSLPSSVARDDTVTALGDAVDALRRYGHTKELAGAVRRLWASGPAVCLARPLERSLEAAWRHTTAGTKLLLWELAGDLLPAEQADAAATECLRILDDLPAFEQQVRPTFVSNHYTQLALGRLLSAADDALHVETVSYLLRALEQGDGVVEDLARLTPRLRPSAVESVAPRWRSAALGQAHSGLSAAMLGLLAGAGDQEAQDVLAHRAQDGDLDALVELPQVHLKDAAGARLAAFFTEQCHTQIADARQNAWGLGGVDHGRWLVWCGLTFPAHANWASVLELIDHPRVATEHKLGAMDLLARRADELPPAVVEQLRQSAAVQPDQLTGVAAIEAPERLQEAAISLGLSLGVLDTRAVLARVSRWLRGGTAQRLSAARLSALAHRRSDDVLLQGMLLTLASDPHYRIRAVAAAALTRALARPANPACEEAVLAAANDAGCHTPHAIASTLPGTCANESLRQQLHDVLNPPPLGTGPLRRHPAVTHQQHHGVRRAGTLAGGRPSSSRPGAVSGCEPGSSGHDRGTNVQCRVRRPGRGGGRRASCRSKVGHGRQRVRRVRGHCQSPEGRAFHPVKED